MNELGIFDEIKSPKGIKSKPFDDELPDQSMRIMVSEFLDELYSDVLMKLDYFERYKDYEDPYQDDSFS